MSTLKPVLYAEDDENDLFFMTRAFEKLAITHPLRTVGDGKEAVAYLSGTKPFENREQNPLPCLMLMDLSMPGKNGLDVLKWMKNEPTLAAIPVVVLTSSNQQSDIHRANILGASGFVVKPGDPQDLLAIVSRIKDYWLSDKRPDGTFTDFAAAANIFLPKAI